MKLERLEQSNIESIAGKGIICYERCESYLKELCEAFHLQNRIQWIVDDNKRGQGKLIFEGRKLPVKNSSSLEQIDFERNVLLITSDYYSEAYGKLCENSVLMGKTDTIYYFANRETEYELAYREKYKDTELENMILFRSGPHASAYVKGMDFADNARALFEYMVAEDYAAKYRLVWLVKDPKEYAAWQGDQNIEFLSFDWSVSEIREERDRYYRSLCLAKYLFFTDAYGFARNCRKDQIRVQLWHGCGFKTRVNFVRCEKRYEYTTVISDVYSKIHQDIYGLREDQVLVTGYAKQDWLFKPYRGWREKLGVAEAEKYIFWMPTFRTAKAGLDNLNEYDPEGQTGLPIVSTYEELSLLNTLLRELNVVLVLKLHPFQDGEKIGKVDTGNIVLLDNDRLTDMDIQINRLLGEADALISDYSSAAVDYMLLDRPIGFTLDDVEEYSESRGFVFQNIEEWLPGRELFSFDDFSSFIREVADGVDSTREKRRELTVKMHKYSDGCNCKRIVKALQI